MDEQRQRLTSVYTGMQRAINELYAYIYLLDTGEKHSTADGEFQPRLELILSPELNRVVDKALEHKDTFQEMDRDYWFLRLTEEVGELAAALAGRHEHSIDHELSQIASLCLNFMRMLERTADD